MTIKELSKNVAITPHWEAKLPYAKQDEWQRSANGYTCTLEFQKRRMTVDFWMGTGIQGKPTASDVLSSLVSDTVTVKNSGSFENWCRDLDLDSDSRKTKEIYQKILSQGQKLAKFLDPAYEDFLNAEID